MKTRAVPAALLLALVAIAACRSAPIYNPSGVALGAPAGTSLADVTQAIKRAGIGLGWQMTELAPGQIRAVLHNRGYMADALVQYDTSTFSITYQNSERLKAEGDQIHKAYNKWIKNLEQRIIREAGLMTRS
jgi:hypothetical protein